MYPPWVVLHIPHDSTVIPDSVRDQFLLGDDELEMELARITDHHTFDLFAGSGAQIVRAAVSRLVVDVERFRDDIDESMSRKGMGAVYTATSLMTPLRRTLSREERDDLMRNYYDPHHRRLEAVVDKAIDSHGRCLVIDCHSFPDHPLPYEQTSSSAVRPDICIGTDDFHTGEKLGSAFISEFRNAGFAVAVNDPFAGALVPGSRYRIDRRVWAIMVEVNRRLYHQDDSVRKALNFDSVARRVRACCVTVVQSS